MNLDPGTIAIYHITDVENLPNIIKWGSLRSDAAMVDADHAVIGHNHIKERRLKEIRVPCCRNRFVGEFVPFYFCPRSPMLYTINRGNTGRPCGCQRTIIHLVSTIAVGIELGREWAISDGNAGAFHTVFYSDINALRNLDWKAIHATIWKGQTHKKQAEFLVADFFPWSAIRRIGCHNSTVAKQVADMLRNQEQAPLVKVRSEWYYEP